MSACGSVLFSKCVSVAPWAQGDDISSQMYTVMCHITTFQSTTDDIYNGGPIRF